MKIKRYRLYVTLIFCLALSPYLVLAQSKPAWTSGVFYSTNNSDVRSFEATGATQEEARNRAAARVIEWKSGATGMQTQVSIVNGQMVTSGSDALTVQARVIVEYFERTRDGHRVYLLVQIAKIPSRDGSFDDIGKILKKVNEPFFAKKKNNYMAWGILNTGYPLTFGTSFAGRHGNFVGVGYYLSLGVDPAIENFSVAPLSYQAGIKFFPYKSFFLSAGYGTLGCEKMSTYNDSDGFWRTEGLRQGEGLILMAGSDVTGNLNRGGVFLSLGAGITQDTFTKNMAPFINIKFGVAWGL